MEFMILALISVFAFFLVRFAAPAAILLVEIAQAALAGGAKQARENKALRNTRGLTQHSHLSNKR